MNTKEDICAHLGDEYDRFLGAIVPPIFQNTLFTRKNGSHGYTYTRVNNPTTEILEKKIAALEGGEACLAFSSGMAAITAAVTSCLRKDSHAIFVRNVYGPTRYFLETYMEKFGVTVSVVTGERIEDFEAACRKETSLIYLESPSSYLFSLQDLEAVSRLAKSKGIVTIIDNTWATPMFQNPLEFGIDIVVHSVTKYLGGHSDVLGGALVARKATIDSMRDRERGLFGATMDPHQAWLALRGVRTLPVRMKTHQASGFEVARFLESRKEVERVFHPGLETHPQYELGRRQLKGYSGLFGFVLKGGREVMGPFVKRLEMFQEGPSWGGFESLVTTPGNIDAETSAKTGIPVGMLRMSIGLENTESLIADIGRSLDSLG